MSGTHLYYNGVLFRDCETLDYSSILEFDESGTHEKFMRTRITVASTLISLYKRGMSGPIVPAQQHPSTIQIPPVLFGVDETTPSRLEEIMQLLAEPRKDFWYALNGVTDPSGSPPPTHNFADPISYRLVLIATGILPAPSPAVPVVGEFVKYFDVDMLVKRLDVLDANNGPKPSGLGSVAMHGGNVMRIQATFEVCRVLSKPVPDSNNPDPGYDAQKVRGVVSNSWSVVDSLDDEGAVTHSVTGKIVVKDKRFKANAMRMFAFPLAFPYARLVSRQYTVDHSGLVLEYQYQFKHAGAAPPQGVRKYEATYTEAAGISGKGAGVYRGQMAIRVMGWHDRSDDATPLLQRERKQKVLLHRALYTILQSRITGISKVWAPLPGQFPALTYMTECKIIEKVGLPELEMQVSVNYGSAMQQEFLNRVANMGNPMPIPEYDPRWWPIDNEWGRLPAGNGAIAVDGDIDNPEFRNVAYPYALSGDPAQSDYFTGYFQPPGNNRHTLPRITSLTRRTSSDAGVEWARPAGFVPTGATAESGWASQAATFNPITEPDFNAIVSKNLFGDIVMGPLEPVTSAAFTGIADVQGSGFQYISYSSEVLNDTQQGVVNLPLSVPRAIPTAKRNALFATTGISGLASSGRECSVAVSLCAPSSVRVYSVSSTRNQKWGEIPEPKPLIVRTSGSGSHHHIAQVETLIRKEFLPETPELRSDGVTREFTHHARYTYALSNPWRGTLFEGSIGDFEIVPVGFSPICKSMAEQNAIVVKGDASTLSPLFTSPQYG